MLTVIRSGCKINLYLHVGERLPDGYHSIDSVFLQLEKPYDVLELSSGVGSHEGIVVSFYDASEKSPAPLSDISTVSNTLTRAYEWYASQTGFRPRLLLRVYKGVPRGAGLGGGSANAATLLKYLQSEAGKNGIPELPQDVLLHEARYIGADVPFFLRGGLAHVSGIGETMRPLDPVVFSETLLVACPPVSVSTAWAFGALDAVREAGETVFSSRNGLTIERRHANTSPLAGWKTAGNDFEEIVFGRYPQLAHLKENLLSCGATLARMSGTGSSVFAFFADRKIAHEAGKKIAKDGVTVYIQHTYDAGVSPSR